MRKFLLLGLVLGLAAGAFAVSPKVLANTQHWVTCHKQTGNHCSEQEFLNHCSPTWYEGDCPRVSPTPTVTPTPTPTIEPTPTPDTCGLDVVVCCDKEEDEICQSTPMPTIPVPTPEPSQEPEHHNSGMPGAPIGPACPAFYPVGPQLKTFHRNGPTSVTVEWGKIDGFVSDYVLKYGPAENLLVWNTIVKGSEIATLNDLPANQSIWVTVAETNSGCVGPFGNLLDP
jgi:hypothetical protein